MNLNKILIITVALAITSLSTIAQGYKITGKTVGLKDSTWLYLRIAKPEQEIDSAMVINNRFSMQGKINEPATQVYLYTAKYTNYVSFWLENKPMQIEVKAGEFKKGVITGSVTEDENQALSKSKAVITNQEDSLRNVLEKTRTQLNTTREADRQFDINYVKTHPASLIAADLLDIYASTWGKEIASELYQNMSTAMKNTSYGQNISDYISLNKTIKLGDKYTDFTQLNVSGKQVKLSDIKAKYILLDFWASWCGPCREENPMLVKTYNNYKDKGFAIFGVSLDDNKGRWQQAIKADNLIWENVSDLRGDKNRAALIYGITGIPDNFLIDANGTIIAKNLRGEALDKKLAELLY